VVEFFLGCAARRRGAMRQPRPGCRTITQADQHDPGGSLKSPGHANRLIMRTSRSYPPRNATAIIAFSRSCNSPTRRSTAPMLEHCGGLNIGHAQQRQICAVASAARGLFKRCVAYMTFVI
jgi:hypothetical protein